MEKLKCLAQVLLLCAAGCSPHQDHGGGFDLSGVVADGGAGDDMATGVVDTGDMSGPLVIAPLAQVLTTAPGGMPTQQYSATVNGTSVSPAWTIDRGEIGSIDVSSGLFTATGNLGGTATITATYLNETATTTVTVKLAQTQNGDPGFPGGSPGPGGFGGVGGAGPAGPASGGQTGVLGGNPTADANVKLLYPYDGTVWPRGILAPLLQWDPGATRKFDAAMVKLHSKNFDYTGTFAANATPFINLPIPQSVWHTLLYSNEGKGDDVTVTVVLEDISGTPTAIGPYTMTWHVAPGTLKGTVYYNSYGTALVTNSGEPSCATTDTVSKCVAGTQRTGPAFGAATLAIKPNSPDPVVVAGTASTNNTGCRVCHAVSANGSSLITQHGSSYSTSSAYALTMANAETTLTPATNVAFPALAPDGTWFMSSSGGMINGDSSTRAYDMTGALLSVQPGLGNTGWTSFQGALPTFSPDGKHLAFNYWASTGGAGTGDQKSLAVLSYDPTNKVFNNFVKLATPAAGVVSWSSFLPTNDAVIYENELKSSAGFGFTRYGNTGSLYWVDLATQTSHALDNLNGKGYVPTTTLHPDDTIQNFEPTVNPVVSGGYAWVVFTSRRLYGNVATIAPNISDPREYHWLDPTQYTPKKLWVAAIDLNAPAGTDPSHPAFYLPGQELLAGNSRGFWTVDPCHPNGTGCETGDECCGGYCQPGGDGGALICTNQMPTCAMEFEKCTKDSDCCGYGAGITCINGFCSKSTPIQ